MVVGKGEQKTGKGNHERLLPRLPRDHATHEGWTSGVSVRRVWSGSYGPAVSARVCRGSGFEGCSSGPGNGLCVSNAGNGYATK